MYDNEFMDFVDEAFSDVFTEEMKNADDFRKKKDDETHSKLGNSVDQSNRDARFRKNNNDFMIDKVSYWNYKYNKISKGISKARELESFILNLI